LYGGRACKCSAGVPPGGQDARRTAGETPALRK
jgi:hypothetical protein